MRVVQLALQRPLTFTVPALLVLLVTPSTLMRTPMDTFPEIDIPVASITWNYNDLPAKEAADRTASVTERSLTTIANDTEHIESQSLGGVSTIKVFFQPNVDIQIALVQTVASTQMQVWQLPPGTTSPLMIKYPASSIPILQLGPSSSMLLKQELNDAALNFPYSRLITVPGIAVSFPCGGKSRQIMVDLDTQKLLAQGLTPVDIANAVGAQNLILPADTQKIDATEYGVMLNGMPGSITALNAISIKISNGATLYLGDVANVRDGFLPQTNVVCQNGQRGVLLSILKNGNASTFEIVGSIYKFLPAAAAVLPQGLKITPLFDQSLFAKAAIEGVIHEALIAVCLTVAIILLFLGDWRNTAIIAVSIPLSILSLTIVLHLTGEIINLMTLGGLALAVEILADDATVTIENIECRLYEGKEPITAILDGAAEIAMPAPVSTLCICIVLVPMFFLMGVTRYLSVPMVEAVISVMLVSYVLSRALVSMLVMMFTTGHTQDAQHADIKPSTSGRIYRAFNTQFEHMHGNHAAILGGLLEYRRVFALSSPGLCAALCTLYLALGCGFSPDVDADQIRLHMRVSSSLRIEGTVRLADEVETAIHEIIPKQELSTILDNLGVPNLGINLSYSNASMISTLDGETLIALHESEHKPSTEYIRRLREALPRRFLGVEFAFQPADIANQILNFGLPSVIDVQLSGADVTTNQQLTGILANRTKQIPGAVDTHVHQCPDQPTLALNMDRTRIQQAGLEGRDVAQNLLVSLGLGFQISPTFWLDPVNGVVYQVAVISPQYRVDSLDALPCTSVASSRGDAVQAGGSQLLGNLVQVSSVVQPQVASHYDITPAVDVYAAVQGRDPGVVAKKVQKAIDDIRLKLSRGAQVTVCGQVSTMESSFPGLGVRLVMAIAPVYLLIVVNSQPWIDPLIIVTTLPAALVDIAWMLFLTGTTPSASSLTRVIMTMGVATANLILLTPFAYERLAEGIAPVQAALEAGVTRLRPVLVTVLVTIIDIVPMALGLGEDVEQNAPLRCAVIGGLLFATVPTLFFIPAVFASVHNRLQRRVTRRSQDLRGNEGYV